MLSLHDDLSLTYVLVIKDCNSLIAFLFHDVGKTISIFFKCLSSLASYNLFEDKVNNSCFN